MSDGSLSQAEIDALLSGGEVSAGAPSSAASGSGISDSQKSAFIEILSGVIGPQSAALGSMIGDTAEIRTPDITFLDRDGFLSSAEEELVEIQINLQEGLTGKHSYLMPLDVAKKIAELIMGQDDVDLNEAALSAIAEAANTIAGSMATTLGDKVGATVMTSPAEANSVLKASLNLPAGQFVKAEYPITVNGAAQSTLIEIFDMSIVNALVDTQGSGSDFQNVDMGAFTQPQQQQQQQQQQQNPMNPMQGMGQAQGNMNTMQGMGQQYNMPNMGQGAQYQSVQFPNLASHGTDADQGNISLLMDVSMEMTVELGRTRRLIKEILGMGEGTIIELDKLAGEPVDILVNHKLIAKGEVVVIDENFGVRVTEIVSPMERMSSL